MRTTSAALVVLALAVSLARAPVRAQQPAELGPEDRAARAERAEAVAGAYFAALMKADLERALELSDVPFALDGRRVVESRGELREVYAALFQRGARELPEIETAVAEQERSIERHCLPIDRAIVVVTAGDEDVVLGMRMSEPPVVVGLRD